MTIAEIILLVAVGAGIYRLLRPFRRWLERCFIENYFARNPRRRRPAIDVTHFTSYTSQKKDEERP